MLQNIIFNLLKQYFKHYPKKRFSLGLLKVAKCKLNKTNSFIFLIVKELEKLLCRYAENFSVVQNETF